MAKSIKKKSELEKENSELKVELRDLRSKLKSYNTKEESDYNLKGFTIFKEKNDFKLVEIGVNPESGSCKILDIRSASPIPNAPHMAAMEGKRFLENVIMKNATK